jgi:prevent-host-death family protein
MDQSINKETIVRHIVSATEARTHLGELMRKAISERHPIIIERGGQPHVVMLSIAEYERLLRGRQENWGELVQRARAQIRAEIGERDLPPSEEVLRQTREQRDEQLDLH